MERPNEYVPRTRKKDAEPVAPSERREPEERQKGERISQYFKPERAGWRVTRGELLGVIGLYHDQEKLNTFGEKLARFLRTGRWGRVSTLGDLGALVNASVNQPQEAGDGRTD